LAEALLAWVAMLTRDAHEAHEREKDRFYHGRTMKDTPVEPQILVGPSNGPRA
jgi:hypothetical protein